MNKKRLTLHRNYFAHGTFSTLCDEFGNELCKVIERPWLNNQRGKSCISEGTYQLKPHISPTHGKCYVLEAPELGVTISGPSQRTHILLHKANLISELEGCLAPGVSFGVLSGHWAVLDSTTAFDQVMKHLDGEQAELVIKRA